MLKGFCAKKNVFIADRKVVEYCTHQNSHLGCINLRLVVDLRGINKRKELLLRNWQNS